MNSKHTNFVNKWYNWFYSENTRKKYMFVDFDLEIDKHFFDKLLLRLSGIS